MINKFLSFNFQLKQFIYFVVAFFCFTIIGTLSHEYGHIAVAKYYGFPTTLHYGSMHYDDTSIEGNEIEKILINNEQVILNKTNYKQKDRFISLWKIKNYRDLLINIGGPLETIVTGTFGLIFLFSRRRKIILFGMKFIDWVLVFITLFWLREVFNLVVGILGVLFIGNENYFGGDEKNIADGLHLFSGAIAIPLAIVGLIISLIVIFKIIPNNYRFTFIASGFFGGITGFLFWYKILGPILLP